MWGTTHTHNNNSSHTTLSHNSLTHNSLTHTQLSHTTLSHTTTLSQLSHTHNLLTHTQQQFSHTLRSFDLQSVWQAWHLGISTIILCGRRGTYFTPFCVAAAAFGDINLHSVWSRCAAAVCVAGVAFGSIDLHSVWQAWHLVTSTTGLALGDINTAARLVPVGAAAVCVVGVASTSILCGVAFGDINLHSVAAMALISLGWLWWRAWFPLAPRLSVWQAWRLEASTSILCGRRGTWRHRTSLCVATDGKCGNSEPEAVALPFTLCGKLNQREANLMLWHSLTLSSVQRFR